MSELFRYGVGAYPSGHNAAPGELWNEIQRDYHETFMVTDHGRRVLAHIMWRAGIDVQDMTIDAIELARNTGMRNLALQIFNSAQNTGEMPKEPIDD